MIHKPYSPFSQFSDPGSGFFQEIVLRVKLVLHLMGDQRVNFFLKLIPIAGLAYFFIPDLGIGPIDDIAILWLVSYLFIKFCPDEVVDEHFQRLKKSHPISRPKLDDDEQVIEGEFQPLDEDVK